MTYRLQDEDMRRRIAEKAGWRCVYCSDAVGPFEVDHIIPRQRGGQTVESNLVWACARCNWLKGYKSVATFLALLADVKVGKKVITRRNKTGRKVKR